VVHTDLINATRNRPDTLRNPGEVPRAPEAQARLAAWAASGLPPARVAEMVFQAVRANELYLLTDGSFDDQIEERWRSILGRRNPRHFPLPSREAPARTAAPE
jgi:hypothetical protein